MKVTQTPVGADMTSSKLARHHKCPVWGLTETLTFEEARRQLSEYWQDGEPDKYDPDYFWSHDGKRLIMLSGTITELSASFT